MLVVKPLDDLYQNNTNEIWYFQNNVTLDQTFPTLRIILYDCPIFISSYLTRVQFVLVDFASR
jgi:hypothetical protein